MMRIVFFIFLLSCVGCMSRPKYAFSLDNVPAAPDYSQSENWAALPSKKDPADLLPSKEFIDAQDSAEADVFFLHPTTYLKDKKENNWNGDVRSQLLNELTDNSTIKYQASIFNGVGRVFAPRYRQAHYYSYFIKVEEASSARKAFQIAYKDVFKAFEYYLDNYNNGRPIIIAAHSQGTTHAIKLLADFFDEKKLQEKLVVAYLVGMPVQRDTFLTIKQCQTAFDVNCFCSWRTFKSGHLPKKAKTGNEIAVNNPISWSTNNQLAPEALNLGGVARKFEGGVIPGMNNAQVHEGILWASKPKFPGSIFLVRKNYHIADYNLFYTNIRRNAQERVIAYLQMHQADH